MFCLLAGESISLRTSLGSSLGLVEAESGQVERLIFDLMLNARASMSSGVLTLQTSKFEVGPETGASRGAALEVLPQGSYVLITIEGIPDGARIERNARETGKLDLIEGSRQGEDALLREIYEIVEKNRGAIEQVSNTEGRHGFKIYLPMSAQRVSSAFAGAG